MSQSKGVLLIVEDDPGLQKQLKWSFDGYEVLVASDREAAIAMVRRHEPVNRCACGGCRRRTTSSWRP